MSKNESPRSNIRPIDVALVRERLEYKDGSLFWKDTYGQRALKGSRAGSVGNNGYRRIIINKVSYLESRLIWALHKGDTTLFLDHIDGDPSNNSIENLREVTALGNAMNAVTRTDNSSGFRNVYWNKKKKYWEVRINLKGKQIYIGSFKKDIEAAKTAAKEARGKYHGEYASYR